MQIVTKKYLNNLKKEIEESRKEYDRDGCPDFCSDYRYYKCLFDLQQHDLLIKNFGNRLFLINNKFVVTCRKKWRIKGKNKWYRYKSIDHLIKNYVM